MFRGTISIPKDLYQSISQHGENISEAVQNTCSDYMVAKYLNRIEMGEKEKESIETYLQQELFKLKRAFDKYNNTASSLMLVAVIEIKGYKFTRELGELCIKQFMETNRLYKGKPILQKYLVTCMLDEYVKDGEFELNEYHPNLETVNKVVLKMKKEFVTEAYAYDTNGELMDYLFYDDYVTFAQFKRKLVEMTGENAWTITDKVAGNTDCALVRVMT